jgi:hypothetical protein
MFLKLAWLHQYQEPVKLLIQLTIKPLSLIIGWHYCIVNKQYECLLNLIF